MENRNKRRNNSSSFMGLPLRAEHIPHFPSKRALTFTK